MKVPELQQVVQAARALPEIALVPGAFEKRVMAAIRACQPVDVLSFWNSLLWRAALACVAISVATGVFVQFGPDSGSAGEYLAADLEQAVLEPITPDETW